MQLLETIRAENGSALHLPYHQRRLERSLRALGHTPRIELAALLNPPGEGIYRCRVLYDQTEAEVAYHPYTPRPMRRLQAVIDDEIDYTLKYADRAALDRLFALRNGADDVVIVKKGMITDTTIANLAFFDGKRWLTPKKPLLCGTARQRLLDEGQLCTADISLESVFSFERCAVMNALLGFVIIEDGIMAPQN